MEDGGKKRQREDKRQRENDNGGLFLSLVSVSLIEYKKKKIE